ncbi:mitochondrial intermediate peptidase [Trichomonascus vanleenenianus]|uniref:metalloendopeptidase n=1 Tax=Trichomonascus vanleenenianus TaxID=2268995 RepID=UPI003ECA1D65
MKRTATALLRRTAASRRWYSYAAQRVHSSGEAVDPAYHDEVFKDDDLRQVFDSPSFFRGFNSSGYKSPTGLFENPYLSSPQGIAKFSERSLAEAQSLAAKIINASAPQELRDVIRNLDRLSDTLCKVIDMVAFVRMSHPNSKFLAAAQASHEQMYEYMNVLNTSVEMYSKLDQVLNDKAVSSHFSEEELAVGRILLNDFKRSGVTLDPTTRQKFIEISNAVSILGQQFLTEARPTRDYISVYSKDAKGLDPQLARQLTRFGRVRIPTSGPVSGIAMRTIASEKVRRDLWLAQRSASETQESHLKGLLQQRAVLAKMMGYSSFAEYELADKMAKSPHNVNRFLKGLSSRSYPLAQQELAKLSEMKANDANAETAVLNSWDRDYYSARYLQMRRSRTYALDTLSSYFSLGTVMQGLSRLFSNIYGVKFVPRETRYGEVWHQDVRRLDVISETEGRVGVMYCDLFEREGKSPNPAHFTVQCSREVFPDESSTSYEESLLELNGKKYQRPIIALVCDFTTGPNGKCLLSFNEVETLFHEMGHAIHSMLGRTSLHNVSGTRCATDFVELPSVLMERFASSPAVLSLYARHHETGEPLPLPLLESYLNVQDAFKHCETYNQIKLSLLDQTMHSSASLSPHFIPHEAYYEMESKHGLFPASRESQWHTYFGHLFGYGSTYYCYLFDRAIADRIWAQVFASDPVSRDAGEKFKSQVLAWGGSRDPWKCIAGVLNAPELENGGEEAMMEIGKSIQL